MKAKLFAVLVEKMDEFIDSDEWSDFSEIYVNENTGEVLAKAVEAVYDAMSHECKLAEDNSE